MIIASRVLTLRSGASYLAVPVNISAPVSGDGYWECEFEIAWPGQSKRSRCQGFDGAQALYNAMQAIAVYLYSSPHHASGDLWWDKPGGGYGFPIPKVGYEDLIGEDRIAQVPD